MSLNAKTFLNFIAGAFAGALAWVLTDVTGWFSDVLTYGHQVTQFDLKYLLYGALFGLILGLMLGIVESLSLDSQRQIAETLALGGLVGFFGGGIGLSIGQFIYGQITPHNPESAIGSPALFFDVLFARAIGYAVIGAIVGASQGIARRSMAIFWQGAFGGAVGGFIGGLGFQIIATVFSEIPNISVLSRLAALIATGALVGFFVGLVQNLFKQAWIRVVLGKNEGKEYLVTKPVTTIGRSELSDIGLYGDKNIAPTHAVIEALPNQKRHRLRHVATGQGGGGVSYPPTVVNGQPVTAEQWLADGDTIQIGKRTLLFQEKATKGMPCPQPPNTSDGKDRAWPPAPSARPASVPDEAVAPPRFVGQDLPTASTTIAPRSAPAAVPEEAFAPPAAPSSDATVVIGDAAGRAIGGMGTRLFCTSGPYAGQSFPLSHAPTTIGRAAERDIPLPADTSVSRSHSRIVYEGGRHIVADDGSSNGTYVNGRRVESPHPLMAGDLLQLGSTTLRYE